MGHLVAGTIAILAGRVGWTKTLLHIASAPNMPKGHSVKFRRTVQLSNARTMEGACLMENVRVSLGGLVISVRLLSEDMVSQLCEDEAI
jgi:hypothetical protein